MFLLKRLCVFLEHNGENFQLIFFGIKLMPTAISFLPFEKMRTLTQIEMGKQIIKIIKSLLENYVEIH